MVAVHADKQKVGHRNPSSSGPSVKIDEIIREYADASTETDPLPSSPAGPSNEPLPPAYTAEAEPVNAQQVPEKAHPRGIAEGIDDAYDEVVGTVGVRCLELENELKGLNLSRGKSRPGKVPFSVHAYLRYERQILRSAPASSLRLRQYR